MIQWLRGLVLAAAAGILQALSSHHPAVCKAFVSAIPRTSALPQAECQDSAGLHADWQCVSSDGTEMSEEHIIHEPTCSGTGAGTCRCDATSGRLPVPSRLPLQHVAHILRLHPRHKLLAGMNASPSDCQLLDMSEMTSLPCTCRGSALGVLQAVPELQHLFRHGSVASNWSRDT